MNLDCYLVGIFFILLKKTYIHYTKFFFFLIIEKSIKNRYLKKISFIIFYIKKFNFILNKNRLFKRLWNIFYITYKNSYLILSLLILSCLYFKILKNIEKKCLKSQFLFNEEIILVFVIYLKNFYSLLKI